MNFWKSSKGGGGGLLGSKKFCCKIFSIWDANLGGSFPFQKFSLQKIATFFPKKARGGGSKAVWNFSKNSSILDRLGFPWFSVGWKWGYLVFFVAKYNEAILLVFLVEKYTLSNYLDASKNTTVCSVFTCVCCVIFSLNVCSVSYLCFSCCCICVLFLSWSCLIFIVFVFYLLSYFCCICHCICVVAKCSQTSHLCE